MLSEAKHLADFSLKYIVMLSEAKHLADFSLRCSEMLHFIQHDMVWLLCLDKVSTKRSLLSNAVHCTDAIYRVRTMDSSESLPDQRQAGLNLVLGNEINEMHCHVDRRETARCLVVVSSLLAMRCFPSFSMTWFGNEFLLITALFSLSLCRSAPPR